jgi:hypothetical protein
MSTPRHCEVCTEEPERGDLEPVFACSKCRFRGSAPSSDRDAKVAAVVAAREVMEHWRKDDECPVCLVSIANCDAGYWPKCAGRELRAALATDTPAECPHVAELQRVREERDHWRGAYERSYQCANRLRAHVRGIAEHEDCFSDGTADPSDCADDGCLSCAAEFAIAESDAALAAAPAGSVDRG